METSRMRRRRICGRLSRWWRVICQVVLTRFVEPVGMRYMVYDESGAERG